MALTVRVRDRAVDSTPYPDSDAGEDGYVATSANSPFLNLPREIRLLIFTFCRSDRWLMVSESAGINVLFNYGSSACRKLLQINRQVRDEAQPVRLPPFCLRFAGRAAFCQFLRSSWSTCPDTGQAYLGSKIGLLVSRNTLAAVNVIHLAPGTTEVGYLDLSSLSVWFPNLQALELDLRKESMWAYSRVPSITREEILIKEINWRLGTIFGVDANSLRRGGSWTLIVHASFMLPADPNGNEQSSDQVRVARLDLVSLSCCLMLR